MLEATPGVERVLDAAGEEQSYGIDHARAGDLVAIAAPDAWFTYYYWLDDDQRARTSRAPSTSTASPATTRWSCSSIRRSGSRRSPSGGSCSKRKAGFRTLLDVIPLDATLVKGSHGRSGRWTDDGPCVISREKGLFRTGSDEFGRCYSLLLRHLGIG